MPYKLKILQLLSVHIIDTSAQNLHTFERNQHLISLWSVDIPRPFKRKHVTVSKLHISL